MVHVVLKEQVDVARGRLRLSDVAACAIEAPICEEFYGVDLGPAPAPGRIALMRIEDLQKILHAEFGDILFVFEKTAAIRVTAAAADVNMDAIQRALQQELDNLLSVEDEIKAVVNGLHLSSLGKIRPGYTNISFPELEAINGDVKVHVISHLMGNMPVKVVLTPAGDGTDQHVLWVRAQIDVEQYLPTVTRDVQAGTILTEDILTMQWQKLARTRQHYVQDSAMLLGKRLKTSLQIGAPIAVNNVAAQFAVKRGATVNAEIRRDGMRVQSKVKAMGNAAVGEQLDVTVIGSGRKLTGVVRNADLVEVNL